MRRSSGVPRHHPALADLDDRQSPHDTITHRFDIGDQRARTLLAGAGMTIDMQGRPVAELSGGQKALESELLGHGASCLLVSHDRSFVRATGNRFWLIDGRKLIETDSPEPFFEAARG